MSRKGIADIKPKRIPFPLEVRLLRKYIPYTGPKGSNEKYYLLVDAKGHAIEAKIDMDDKKRDLFMKEGNCYSIKGHICTYPRALGKIVNHPAALVFNSRTEVMALADRDIPRYYYNFATYKDLRKRLNDNNALLTDYLGCIQSSTGLYKHKTHDMLKLNMMDLSGYIVTLTLWGKAALTFTKENVIGKVLAVSATKVTEYQASVQLESNDIATFVVNPPFPDLQEIQNRFRNVRPRQMNHLELTEIVDEKGVTIADLKMKQPDEYKNKYYTCEGYIKDFDHNREWFSVKCPEINCNRRVYEEVSEDGTQSTFICEKAHPVTEPKYLYNVNATLQDATGTMQVVMYNESMEEALNMSCKDMVLKHGFDDATAIPEPMISLIGTENCYTMKLKQGSSAVVHRISKLHQQIQDQEMPLLTLPSQPQTPAPKTTRKHTAAPGETQLSPKRMKEKDE